MKALDASIRIREQIAASRDDLFVDVELADSLFNRGNLLLQQVSEHRFTVY